MLLKPITIFSSLIHDWFWRWYRLASLLIPIFVELINKTEIFIKKILNLRIIFIFFIKEKKNKTKKNKYTTVLLSPEKKLIPINIFPKMNIPTIGAKLR